jgi:acylphosphatase
VSDARAHARVRGRVQGVFFRTETRDRARSLGVSGWVSNRADGSVEVVFEGEREKLDSLLEWCRRGPRGASVDEVDVSWEEPRGDVAGFSVR